MEGHNHVNQAAINDIFSTSRHFNISRMLFIYCGLTLSLLWIAGPSTMSAQSDEEYITELQNLGFLPPNPAGAAVSAEVLEEAVMQYQSYHGLPETGKFDTATIDKMSQPRCGNPDKFTGNSRWPRYAATSGWGRTHITWNVVNYTQDLPKEQVDDSIERAFKLWSDNTVLTFERVAGTGEEEVDIRIDFFAPYTDHGDDMLFDGPGRVLAHAFLPWFSRLKGDVHFDDGETWTHRSYSGANLWLVAAHEIGHSLGLQHSFIQGSLMYPYHIGYIVDYKLHIDDIEGIEHMYGDGIPDYVTQKPGPPNNPLVPRLCFESFDAIDVAVDGYTYIFKGDYYWRLDDKRIMDGYPKLISQGWPGLQSDIDTALTVKNPLLWREVVGKTFFFKGRAVWRYTGRSLDIGYPKDLSTAFPGFPNSVQRVNAAVELTGNGHTFFLTDGVFYTYTWRRQVEGPYRQNAFKGIPADIADAVQLKDNYMYFFSKEMQYYQVSPWFFTTSSGYPLQTPDVWFECANSANPLRIGTEPPDISDSNKSTLPSHNFFTVIALLIVSLGLL